MIENKKLDKKLKKEIKKDIEREVKEEIEDRLHKKLDKKLEGSLKGDIDREVRKRFHERLYEETKKTSIRFGKGFKKHAVTAITAAFAFLVALSWRNPIQNSVNSLIKSMGLVGKEIYIEYLSAIVITLIAVLVLMLVSRWEVKEAEK